jgi:hypothetical protein
MRTKALTNAWKFSVVKMYALFLSTRILELTMRVLEYECVGLFFD